MREGERVGDGMGPLEGEVRAEFIMERRDGGGGKGFGDWGESLCGGLCKLDDSFGFVDGPTII